MVNENSFIFASLVSEEEWSEIPKDTAKKIEHFVSEKIEEYITSKALLETNRFNTEQNLNQLKKEYEVIMDENEALRAKFEVASNTIASLETQVVTFNNDYSKLQAALNKSEEEASEYRHQRNLAYDERDEQLKMLQRRDAEVERMRSEIKALIEQLETAVNTKCEALAKAESVESLRLTLEYKEKRIEQERELLNKQVSSLSEELGERTEELLNMRRDNTSRCVQLETKLSEKTQELAVAYEQVKSTEDLNNNLSFRIDELSQNLLIQRESETKMNESYLNEIEVNTKLANTYKEMYEKTQNHAEQLQEALAEVQELLKDATEQYGQLETKHKESELAHEELIAKKKECIAMLNRELQAANELLDNPKTIHELSGTSVNISGTSRSGGGGALGGATLTDTYSKYLAAKDKLLDAETENRRLNNYIAIIIKEVEEKGPIVKKLRDDYCILLDTNEEIKNVNDSLLADIQQLREANAECRRLEGTTERENLRLRKEVADLSRQVCHLLRENDLARTGSSCTTSPELDFSDSVSSAEIISKKLVTFNDISELQKTNRQLLALVRELTEKQEEAESFDPTAIANLRNNLENLRETQHELLEERERHNKMMETLKSQRDMYKNLYVQAVRAAGEELPTQLERQYNISENTENDKNCKESTTDSHIDDKIHELENQIEMYKKQIEHLKTEKESYRDEKATNEKMVNEQLDSLRHEVKELTSLNCKLHAKTEMNEEKFKTMKNNIQIYKKQITALEKQNKIYSETIVKHEQSIIYLKDETLQTQTRLSKAEAMLSNHQKENALLKDSESRLLKDRQSQKQKAYSESLIHTNLELIKASLERNDSESRLRLESRLDAAHRECAALRRRLQEEQDRFRQLSEHLQNQTQTAVKRYEEEKEVEKKLREELVESREELSKKCNQIEELTKQLKLSVLAIPETNPDGRQIRLLEQQVGDCHAEIDNLKSKLKSSKESSEQYYSLAQEAEQQMKIVQEKEEEYITEIEKQKKIVTQLQEKCAELEGELAIQMDDQDMSNILKVGSRSSQLQDELNVASMDLKTIREELENVRSDCKSLNESLKAVENKYAREVMLHSADLKSLTELKEQFNSILTELNQAKHSKDQAVEALDISKKSWENQEASYIKEKEQFQDRFSDLDTQNSLLLSQIEALNTQLTLIQTHVNSMDGANQSTGGDVSFNRSFTEDEVKSSEQLLKIIRYLRQEKDIAVNKSEILEAEHLRLKSQLASLTKQLEETRARVEGERQKSEVAVVTAAKHAEVLRKVETLNAITDSNRSLRQERDSLMFQLSELKVRTEELETCIEPIQERNIELTTKSEAMQTENISLRAECNRWRQRANSLIEKSNRSSPEDLKKLQNERDNLSKQLTVEKCTVTKLTDEVNTFKQDKKKLEDALKNLKIQHNILNEETTRLREELVQHQNQIKNLLQSVEQLQDGNKKLTDENQAVITDAANKEASLNELRSNLQQIRKIAKKYKIQCEEQTKEIETLKQQIERNETTQNENLQREEQLRQEHISELDERLDQLKQEHTRVLDQINNHNSLLTDENQNHKKEIDSLKQQSLEKEDRFKALFKNAKERIVTLTEENKELKEELKNQDRSGRTGDNSGEGSSSELLAKIETLLKEKDDVIAEKLQEKEKYNADIEALTQRVNHLQRQLGLQQGSKPSTSSGSAEKSSSEPPTANIKPMAGHSTNTQTQSVPIQPWRNAGETPLASIRPMSAQLRTVAVLPTSQSPSAVMVPPQQVHTTGSSSVEALSSSPTSSHTDYVPATSSASSAMLVPRQVAVPPSPSLQDPEDDDSNMQVHTAPQQQTVALVLPRVELLSSVGQSSTSGSTQEQGTSSSNSSNTVTTTQATLKRQRDADTDTSCQPDEQPKPQHQTKRTRMQQAGTVSDSGLEVEYQVPTSSQRDHDDDNVIILESDEDGGPDEGEGVEDDPDDPDTEGYDMEGMEQENYEEADCPDGEEEETGNEVEVIDDSNHSETSGQDGSQEGSSEQPQSEAISSGTDGTGRSVPSTPLQSSPQESVPANEEQVSQQVAQHDDIPVIMIHNAEDDTNADAVSRDCMGPPVIAGTSSERSTQNEAEEMVEGDDEVSSEGEKPPATEEGEEEGREAEASPSTNTRTRMTRGFPQQSRRSVRTMANRGGFMRSGPTPIVWDSNRGRPNSSQNFSPRTARRPRGRSPFRRF